MNVTVENLGPCKKLLRIEADAEVVNQTFADVTQRYVRTAAMPGFRPGKAPRSMVEKKFGKDIEDDVRRKVVPDSYQNAIKAEKIRVVGQPDIEEIQFGRSQPLQLAVTVETEPEFTLPEHTGLAVKLEAKSVTQEDVDRAMTSLRDRKTQLETVGRPVQEGDVVVLNYKGTCEGKPISEWAPTARGLTEKQGFWVETHATAFIPGFGPQLIGAAAGEKRNVEVDFAADFVTKEVAGKKGVFEVEVVEVKEKKAPEIDDAFAKGYGAENLERLREGVWKDLERELEYQKNRATRNQIARALLDGVQFELPEVVLQNETRRLVYEIVEENRKRGITSEVIEQNKEDIFKAAKSTAVERVKLTFIFQRIAEKEKIEATKEDVIERIQQLAHESQMPPERFVKELEKGAGIASVYEQVMNEKVMRFLIQHAKVEEVPAPAPAPTPTPA